jgi:hypothetical protein
MLGSPQASVAWGLSSCAWALAGIVSQAGAKGAWRCHRSRAQGSGKPLSPRRKLRSSQAQPDLFARGCVWGIYPRVPQDSIWVVPSEVAQPTRSGHAAYVSVHRELQVVLDIVLYQIGYFNYSPVSLEYMRRGRGPLADRSWR